MVGFGAVRLDEPSTYISHSLYRRMPTSPSFPTGFMPLKTSMKSLIFKAGSKISADSMSKQDFSTACSSSEEQGVHFVRWVFGIGAKYLPEINFLTGCSIVSRTTEDRSALEYLS